MSCLRSWLGSDKSVQSKIAARQKVYHVFRTNGMLQQVLCGRDEVNDGWSAGENRRDSEWYCT